MPASPAWSGSRPITAFPKSLVNNNYDNFAPRIGFAWRPFGNNRTVVRSGFGIFYTGSRLSAMRTDLTGGFPFSLSQSFTGSTNAPGNLTLANPFPASLAKLSGITTSNGFEVNPPSPYLASWNFTIERELGRGVGIETGYSRVERHAPGPKYDINQQVRTPAARPRAPIPVYGDIEYYTFGGNSSYQAGTVTVRKRFEHGLFFRANYTFGKSIDTASGLNYAGNGGYQGAQDSLNLKVRARPLRFRHPSRLQHEFRLADAVPPELARPRLAVRGHRDRLQRTALNAAALRPVQRSRPGHASGSTGQRRARQPQPRIFGSTSAAFAIVPDSAFRYGNSGRNILDGPGSANINLSLSKWFRLAERAKAQFRWETFNTTNHTNFNLPAVNMDKSNAGTITKAKGCARDAIGMRYEF